MARVSFQAALWCLLVGVFVLVMGALRSSVAVSAPTYAVPHAPCADALEVAGDVGRAGVVCGGATLARAHELAGARCREPHATSRHARSPPLRPGSANEWVGQRLVLCASDGGSCAPRTERIDARLALALGLPIDLNTADVSALRALPRVGPRLAARIVADRAARGVFRGVDDLGRVRGVGTKTLRRLRPFVTARGQAP